MRVLLGSAGRRRRQLALLVTTVPFVMRAASQMYVGATCQPKKEWQALLMG